MNATTIPTATARRTSEGADSVVRLHEAWRKGALRVVTTPMTSDPLRLRDNIPTLTERQAARHHRSAPHVHLVHRVDTERDIPHGMAGVAIGGTALPDEPGYLGGDEYQAEPIVPVDPKLRGTTWRLIIGAYVLACGLLAYFLA